MTSQIHPPYTDLSTTYLLIPPCTDLSIEYLLKKILERDGVKMSAVLVGAWILRLTTVFDGSVVNGRGFLSAKEVIISLL